MAYDYVVAALLAGWSALMDYVSAHVLFSIIPAFFLAGAIAALLKKDIVMKYLGPEANRAVSYFIASAAGVLLAVCSCTILPLFTGIYKRGAGLGPAITFLYSGPAISILAIIITASVLGYDIGAARAVIAVALSIVIGLIMAAIFKGDTNAKAKAKANAQAKATADTKTNAAQLESGCDCGSAGSSNSAAILLIILLLTILLIGPASYIDAVPKAVSLAALASGAAYLLWAKFSKDEIKEFGSETWMLFKKIFPILLLGSFLSGVVGAIIPVNILKTLFGANDPISCLIASVVGSLLYIPTIMEVPIVGTLFGYSSGIMAAGPALAILLTGPTISLPSMVVIWRTIGGRKAGAYIILVILLSTVMALAAGMIIG